MDVILIAAVTQDGFIARHPKETITWSQDLNLFKKQTMGHPLIMGSRTRACIKDELKGREIIVFHRKDKPKDILKRLKTKRCFIAGGGKTNSKFISYLTHLFLTPHPMIFGKGVRLFTDEIKEPELLLEEILPVNKERGIYQYQYKIK